MGKIFSPFDCLIEPPTAGSTFNPLTDITGWQGYYDMVDGAGVSYSVSGGVFTWIDKSGNSNNLVAPSSGESPVYNASGINSKPTVQFKANNFYTNMRLTRTTGFPTGSYTAVFVIKSDPWPTMSLLSGTGRFIATTLTSRGLQVQQATSPSIASTNGYNFNDASVNKWITTPCTQIVTVTWDTVAKTLKMFINGQPAGVKTSAPDHAGAQITVGVQNQDQFKGHMAFFGLTNTVISNSQLLSLHAYLKTQYIPTIIRPVYACGDSLTAGQAATTDTPVFGGEAGFTSETNGPLHWMSRYLATEAPTANVMFAMYGMAGLKTQEISTNCGTYIDTLTEGALTASPYLLSWTGANYTDMTALGTYNAIKDHVVARKATGKYNKIIVATPIPRTSIIETTHLLSVASMMRSGMSSDFLAAGCDALCDLASRAEFDADGDYTNATYYNQAGSPPDRLHLLTAGYDKVGGYNKDDTIAAGLF